MKFSDKPAAWILAAALSCSALLGFFASIYKPEQNNDPSFGAAASVATGSQQPRCRSAEVVRVIDGDTIECHIIVASKSEIGSDLVLTTAARLYGINSPDTATEGPEPTKAATANLQKLIKKFCGDKRFSAKLYGRDKYGRVLIEILGTDKAGGEVNLNQQQITDGHAKAYLP